MRMQPVTVHVPRDLKRWLEKEAKELDLSFAAYVRRALKLYRHQEEGTHRGQEAEPPPAEAPGPEAERPGP